MQGEIGNLSLYKIVSFAAVFRNATPKEERCVTSRKTASKETIYKRQRDRMVRALNLKFGDTGFKSRSDHQLDLFHAVPGLTPRLHMSIAN